MLPDQGQRFARVRVATETETDHGWVFGVEIAGENGAGGSGGVERRELTLSWPDYEHWSHGMRSPSAVAEAVAGALLELRPDFRWPARFDASTARRLSRELDGRVRELL